MFFQKKIDRKYLRKCESRTIGIQRTTKTLRLIWQTYQDKEKLTRIFFRLRGTDWTDVGEGLKCDLTGGFDKT